MSGIMLSLLGGASAPPTPPGQQAFTDAGTFTWVAPAGVTSVCVVCVGAGGVPTSPSGQPQYLPGGGGGLAWKNNITVVPGTGYGVNVGNPGSTSNNSSFIASSVGVIANGAVGRISGGPAGTYDGGGAGGNGGISNWNGSSRSSLGGGGGAGGYTSNGGQGAAPFSSGQNGFGGGGGGGGPGYRGGGVGIFGEGSSGGASNLDGLPGSNGVGPVHGGGGESWQGDPAGRGAVRIIWGAGRAFPSTNTGNL